jgi:hypothetical protein
MKNSVETLEQGDIFFFYRPKVEELHPKSESDIQRFYFVLHPENKDLYRLSVVGQKELPNPVKSGRSRYWGYVSKVSTSPESIRDELGPERYQTKTRGERFVGTARPGGEGVYRIVNHNGHTHLVYALELPKKTGDVQHELNIEGQASYVMTIKNPETSSSPYASLPEYRNASYPRELQEHFRERRFSEVLPEYLNFEGAEFILIASSENIHEELGIEMHTDDETIFSADIFTELKLDRSKRPKTPLFTGEWQ